VIAGAAVLVAWALLVPGHNRSEGRSRFRLEPSGDVDVEIRLGVGDVPDLCPTEPLAPCLRRSLPLLLKLRADGRPCEVGFVDDTTADGVVVLHAHARCAATGTEPLPRELVVDWGLFAASDLDHVSIAQVEEPHAPPSLGMLSRRSPRLVVHVARAPLWSAGPVALLALLALAAVVVRGLTRRWRGRSVQPKK
jgi:hypothetical protein